MEQRELSQREFKALVARGRATAQPQPVKMGSVSGWKVTAWIVVGLCAAPFAIFALTWAALHAVRILLS